MQQEVEKIRGSTASTDDNEPMDQSDEEAKAIRENIAALSKKIDRLDAIDDPEVIAIVEKKKQER